MPQNEDEYRAEHKIDSSICVEDCGCILSGVALHLWVQPWSKPEGLEVRLPIRPAMKSEAINEKNRYSLKRVPNYF